MKTRTPRSRYRSRSGTGKLAHFRKILRYATHELPQKDFSRIYHWSYEIFKYQDIDKISLAITELTHIRRSVLGKYKALDHLIYLLKGNTTNTNKNCVSPDRRMIGLPLYGVNTTIKYTQVLTLISNLLRLDEYTEFYDHYIHYAVSMCKLMRLSENVISSQEWKYLHDNYLPIRNRISPMLRELDEMLLEDMEC